VILPQADFSTIDCGTRSGSRRHALSSFRPTVQSAPLTAKAPILALSQSNFNPFMSRAVGVRAGRRERMRGEAGRTLGVLEEEELGELALHSWRTPGGGDPEEHHGGPPPGARRDLALDQVGPARGSLSSRPPRRRTAGAEPGRGEGWPCWKLGSYRLLPGLNLRGSG